VCMYLRGKRGEEEGSNVDAVDDEWVYGFV